LQGYRIGVDISKMKNLRAKKGLRKPKTAGFIAILPVLTFKRKNMKNNSSPAL